MFDMLESVNLIVRLIEKKRSEMLDQSPTFAACSPARCIPLLLLSELLVVVLYLVIPRVSASSIHGWRVERKKGRKEGFRRMPTILGGGGQRDDADPPTPLCTVPGHLQGCREKEGVESRLQA